jgi:hypothetical protein
MKRYHEKTADLYSKRDWTEEESRELCIMAEQHRIGLFIPYNYLCYLNGTRDRNSIYTWHLKVNPNLNHGKWSATEEQAFDEALQFYNQTLNWQEISEFVGTRTAFQCKERYELKYHNPEKYINWSPEEDQLLLESIKKHGTHWVKIANNDFPNRTDHSCLFRYTKLMSWKKQNEWFENQPDYIKEFILFLFKKRKNLQEEPKLYTSDGELVPTIPKFGPGNQSFINIIEKIVDKTDLIAEFINKKNEGNISISLLVSIHIIFLSLTRKMNVENFLE